MPDEPASDVIRSVPPIDDVVDKYPVTFVGDALQLIDTLRNELRNVSTREDVVMRGLGLLQAAQGKDVILKDKSGASESVKLWR